MEINIKQINQNKSVLRKKILKKRNKLSEKKREKYSEKIAKIIFNEQTYQEAIYVLLFLSFGTEVNTDIILNKALQDGKKVYAPRIINYNNSKMEFYELTSALNVTISPQGIREPFPNKESLYIPQEKTLCITPGIVFDKNKNRIGYGKGFYDTFFKICSCANIAICFDFQILKNIPTTDMDQSVIKIISERRII
jgi:5-formyltetrahydrofolate cyclo-ligase